MPLNTCIQLTRADGELVDEETYTYILIIGRLLYLSVCTRPDIAQAVGALSKYMQEPPTLHWQAAKGLLRYVAPTNEHGIVDGRDPGTVIGYCDADYAEDLNTRRSTTGYVFICIEELSPESASASRLRQLPSLRRNTLRQHRRSRRPCGCELCWATLES